jgi:hypothetical protein
MKREDVIREVQSMITFGGYQVAKSIVKLADQPADTFKRIGSARACFKRPMSQQEAARIVAKAKARIELVDSTD